jgi:thioredoxin-dependent peroxiredoxin
MSKHKKYHEERQKSPSRNGSPFVFVASVTVGVVLLVWGLTAISGSTEKAPQQPQAQNMDNHHGSKEANEQVFSLMLGKEAPDFTLEDYDGKQINLKQLRGKKVVLFFTEGLMCYPACWNQMAAFGKDPAFNTGDVVTLNITVDKKNEWQQAVEKMPELAKASVLFDSDRKVSNTYGVLTLPSSMHRGEFPGHTYLIVDRNGIVQFIKDDPQMAIRNDELKAELKKID